MLIEAFLCSSEIVLFFCTFLALRSQDNGDPIQSFSDWKLHREEEVFKA